MRISLNIEKIQPTLGLFDILTKMVTATGGKAVANTGFNPQSKLAIFKIYNGVPGDIDILRKLGWEVERISD